jgi:hypothetical protein
MQNGNGHAAAEPVIRVIASPHGSEVVEFSLPLHVVKRCGRDGEADAYTIAIWEGTVLHSLCLLQPLETALSVLASILRSASKSGEPTQSEASPINAR